MLFDYGRALDGELHERVQALTRPKAEPKTMPEAWRELNDRRRLDVCVGLVLAYAAMREPSPRSSHGFTDAMATNAIGSFEWWCRWALDTWEDEGSLGPRMGSEDIEELVALAREHLEGLNPGLLAVLVRVVPQDREVGRPERCVVAWSRLSGGNRGRHSKKGPRGPR